MHCLLRVKLMESLAPVSKSREFYLQRLHQRSYLYEFLTQPLVKPQIVIVLLEKQFARSIRYPCLKSELVEAVYQYFCSNKELGNFPEQLESQEFQLLRLISA